MKLVRIIARLNVGGPARHVVWLTAGLREAGFETVLVAGVVPAGEDDMGYFAAAHGVEPRVIPQMSREISPQDAVTVWKLYKLFKRERPAIVHTHTAKAGTVGRVAGFLYRWLTFSTLLGRPRPCRFVHTYHGHIFHSYYGPLKTRFFLVIEKTLALMSDRIVVISPQQFREIHEEFGVGSARQFRVIPLGLDTKVFGNWKEHRRALRDELQAGDSEVLVGIVGRLTEVKNHALFLQAAAIFKEKFGVANEARRVRFVIIGDGHLREDLEEQARALGLARDVLFLGTRDDPENFYPALDVVALTSLNEGTPLTLIEAMANARACLATKVGGVVDLLGEERGAGQAAWAVCERGVRAPSKDAASFADALSSLVDDAGLREELGGRGRLFVEQNYSKDRLLADVTNLYRELTEETAESKVQSPKSKVKNESSSLDSI
ncbi:MAG TPA: glycosyltransferase [Pyrinomonadaceae bacterium]|jgi:glycosyltransferase involved in cell wall biosynthesis